MVHQSFIRVIVLLQDSSSTLMIVVFASCHIWTSLLIMNGNVIRQDLFGDFFLLCCQSSYRVGTNVSNALEQGKSDKVSFPRFLFLPLTC